MNTLIHAILYSVMIGVSFISTAIPPERNPDVLSNSFSYLNNDADVPETKEILEKKEEKGRYEINTSSVIVYDSKSERIFDLKLEEYVTGVLLAEMPSWYDFEAIKAMAVSARTYTIYKMNKASHKNGADVCTSPSHCQAYYELDDAVSVWNEKSAMSAFDKVKKAVDETKGEIIVWENEPVLAMYHASSFMYTRSAIELSYGNIPYLKSVYCPLENKENTKVSKKVFSKKELLEKLSVKDGVIECVWENDKCKGLKVGESFIPSHIVRQKLSLESGSFDVREENESVEFTSYGYGHGVGLSQLGADLLAKEGKRYDEILNHYYVGTKLANLKINE